MTKFTVGIIGGTGGMGQFFKRFFEKNGCKVLIASRSTDLKPTECAKKCDVVIISVPIKSTLDVIKKIGPFVKEDGLLMDLTSLKKEPVGAMLKYSRSEVIGCHPVFGPGVSSIKEQSVVLCPARGKKWMAWLKELLIKNNALVKVTTPERHDRMMAVIQGLVHFGSITVTHTLKELGVNIKDSLEYASPIYKLRLDMLGRILNQDPELYADIEISNPEVKNVLKAYVNSSKKLLKAISKKDRQGFIDYFKESADYLGDFKKEAEKESDYLIEKMVDR
ncbi:MAG: prephenate dehydrogenase/arogenate dehydrogenase family protein [Nanoarchaeota archaeon]|nr:prephenate dehydrogenase/arogenate dehydrogenase family protein [Nanoarchaeota archaeon]MBU1704940.1 prephenate dehydrogenase/arogenate dehydrogenase family protein [Nanoarchaeota archaeon]